MIALIFELKKNKQVVSEMSNAEMTTANKS